MKGKKHENDKNGGENSYLVGMQQGMIPAQQAMVVGGGGRRSSAQQAQHGELLYHSITVGISLLFVLLLQCAL